MFREAGVGRVAAIQPHGSPSKETHWPPHATWFSEGKRGLAEGWMEFSWRQAGGQANSSGCDICEGEAKGKRGTWGGPVCPGPHGLPAHTELTTASSCCPFCQTRHRP